MKRKTTTVVDSEGNYLKAVGLSATCQHCNTEVQVIVTKRQLKALLKGMACSNPSEADILVENILKRDKQGSLKQ